MNNVGLSKLLNKVFIVEPIKVSAGSKFFNNRNDEEPRTKSNKYAIKTKSARIAKDGIE